MGILDPEKPIGDPRLFRLKFVQKFKMVWETVKLTF